MAHVTSILIYSGKHEPGQALHEVGVGEEGLDGDRRKTSPVHLVSVTDYVESYPRANLVLDLSPGELLDLRGHRLPIGTVELSRSPARPRTVPASTPT